jgi:hypothetical protein
MVLVLVLVSAAPQFVNENDFVQAARVWCTYAILSWFLYVAVLSGLIAFFCAAGAVYPREHVLTDVVPLCVVCGCLMAFTALQWGITL